MGAAFGPFRCPPLGVGRRELPKTLRRAASGADGTMAPRPAFRRFAMRYDTRQGSAKKSLTDVIGRIPADDDMREVLTEFASLDPDPIDESDADAARRNPTPADAVRRV